LALIVALCAFGSLGLSAEPDFPGMLSAMDHLSDFAGQDVSVVYTIVSTKPNEPDTVYEMSIFRRDFKEQIVMIFLKPEAKKGQGMLKVDDDIYAYDPDAGFTHSSFKENIQSSDAKNSDMKATSYANDYDIKKTEEGTLGKYPVWILTLKAKTNEPTYDWIKIYMRKDKPIALKMENYSVAPSIDKARLLRTVQIPPKYIDVAGKSLPVEQRIIDEVNKGEKTVLTISADQKSGKYLVSVGKLPDTTFTKSFLEQANKK
jgi:hypothetical protein